MKTQIMSILMFSLITPNMAQTKTDQIIFSNQPFEKNTAPQNEFNEAATIYGQLNLNQPIRNYCRKPDNWMLSKFKKNDGYNNYITFFVRPIGEDERSRTNHEIKLYIKDEDLDKAILDFDVAPPEASANSLFAENNTFLNEVANTSSTYSFFGSKVEFIIELKGSNLGEMSYDYDMPEPTGHLVINLEKADYRSQNTWKENVEITFSKLWKIYFN